MGSKQLILLKITGSILTSADNSLDKTRIESIAQQINALKKDFNFSIVIGGGNFFRGNKQGKKLGLTPSVAHQIGMIATTMNGLIIKDIFEQNNLPSKIVCAFDNYPMADKISKDNIAYYFNNNICIIFTGGTGNPFFSTDTAAVLRGLQIEANEIWKATNVDGIYEEDPNVNPKAALIKKISFQDAINKKIGIMDLTALVLAKEHNKPIKLFNIFESDALIKAAKNKNFGSLVTNN